MIPANNGKLQWWTEAVVCTVHEVEHHNISSSAILADEYHVIHPRHWMKQTIKTLEEAMEFYIVEIIAKSHILKQQVMSYRFSTCQILWQGRVVGYS